MQLNFVNPVLNSCNFVLRSVAGLQLQAGKPLRRMPDDTVTGRCITGLISTKGANRQASLAIVFGDTVMRNIVEEMLPKDVDQSTGVSIDLVGEISNMILGRAKNELEDQGYNFQMSLPTMMIGYDYVVPHSAKGIIMQIPYASSGGPFYIEVCFDGPPVSEREAKAAAMRVAARDGGDSKDIELF